MVFSSECCFVLLCECITLCCTNFNLKSCWISALWCGVSLAHQHTHILTWSHHQVTVTTHMVRSCKWLRSGSHMALSYANTHAQSLSTYGTHTDTQIHILGLIHTHTYCLHPLALLCCTDLAPPRPTLLFYVCVCVGVCCVLLSKWSISEDLRHCCFLHVHRPEEGCWTISPGRIIVCSHKEHHVPEGKHQCVRARSLPVGTLPWKWRRSLRGEAFLNLY